MTDSTGTVVWSADYKPFGEATISVSTITNNLRFPGQYFDQETGLNYNYYRDYNPVIGRYIEADPIGLKGGINLYAYVGNRPINFIDPEGTSACPESFFMGSDPFQDMFRNEASTRFTAFMRHYEGHLMPGGQSGDCCKNATIKCRYSISFDLFRRTGSRQNPNDAVTWRPWREVHPMESNGEAVLEWDCKAEKFLSVLNRS